MVKHDTIHKFEEAGLGKAPFRVIGYREDRGPHRQVLPSGIVREVGSPGQPMGVCKYCYTGIAEVFVIQGSGPDDQPFDVGNVCVGKTGDAGLKRVVEAKVRELRRARRHERETEQVAELKGLLADESVRKILAGIPHGYGWAADQGMTRLDQVEWMIDNAGNSGKIRMLRLVKRSIESE